MDKPSKQDRIAKDKQEKQALARYRQEQVVQAIHRDNSQCVFCWFLLGVTTKRDEIHHVYGRGTEAGDWRERYENLLCTCKRHHPPPIKSPGLNPNLDWVEAVRKAANEFPINPKFRPGTTSETGCGDYGE